MAKSKIRASAPAAEKNTTPNPLTEQFYAVRSEVRKVTWPTREEARALTIAVTVATIVIAIFLFLVDLLFEGIMAGIVGTNIIWIVSGVVVVVLLTLAFYTNGKEA